MRIYAPLLLLLSSISVISQDCDNVLYGKVVDFHDGSVLAGALLIVAGTEQTVETDVEGKFRIPGLCEQTYSIQVSHPYCATKGFTVKVAGNTKRTFLLEHHMEELDQVIVEGQAYGDKAKTIQQDKISNDKLEQFSSGSLGDALNSVSGVSSLNTGNTVVKPMVNGLYGSRVVVINNGVRMEDQEWGAEHAPNMDVNTIGNITLIKGAGALQYSGDAIGGAVVAETPKIPIKDSLYGKTLMTLGSNGRGGTLTSQVTKSQENGWFGTVQGTIKRYGDFEAPEYVLSNTGIFERNASLRLGLNRIHYGWEGYYSYFRNGIGILRASHLGGAQDQVRAINSDRPLIIEDFTYDISPPKQEVTHHLARLSGFKKLEGLGKLSAQYNFQQNNRLEFDIRRGDDRNKASLDLRLRTHAMMMDLHTNPWERMNVKTGISARYQNNFAANTGVRRLIPDYDKYELGAYAIADYRTDGKWLFEGGARFDYTHMDVLKYYRSSFWELRGYDELFPEIVVSETTGQVLTNPKLNYNNASAMVGARYSLGDDYRLYFNYSLASRAPNPSELFSEGLHHSASRIELGDLRFKSEVAHRVALTLERNNEVFGFSINPYINSIDDFIVIEPTEIQQTIRGNFQVWEYRQTQAQLMGVDVDARYAFAENFQFTHQFSLVKGYDRTRNAPLIHMPPVSTKNGIIYRNPGLNNLHISLQSDYVFRQNEFPDNNFEVFVPETETMENVDVSTPPDAYHLLNFNSGIDVQIGTTSKLNIGIGITNVLNTSYRNYLNRLRYYADDLGRNFLLQLKINY
ncbi:MAG: TonB-dependent receptor [Flavobacteriaceae bacterium]